MRVSDAGVAVTRDRHQGIRAGRFELVYRTLTEAERDAFWTDYDGDPGEFTYTWPEDSTTHQVVYEGRPEARFRQDFNRWDLFVFLALVPDFSGNLLLEDGDALLLEDDDNLLLEG